MFILSTLKTFLLIIGIPTLPLGFLVGTEFMIISFTSLLGVVAIDKYQTQLKNGGIQSSYSKTLWSLAVIVVGIGLYLNIMSFGSLGSIDTTGQASPGTQVGALLFCSLLVLGGLALVNRNRG